MILRTAVLSPKPTPPRTGTSVSPSAQGLKRSFAPGGALRLSTWTVSTGRECLLGAFHGQHHLGSVETLSSDGHFFFFWYVSFYVEGELKDTHTHSGLLTRKARAPGTVPATAARARSGRQRDREAPTPARRLAPMPRRRRWPAARGDGGHVRPRSQTRPRGRNANVTSHSTGDGVTATPPHERTRETPTARRAPHPHPAPPGLASPSFPRARAGPRRRTSRGRRGTEGQRHSPGRAWGADLGGAAAPARPPSLRGSLGLTGPERRRLAPQGRDTAPAPRPPCRRGWRPEQDMRSRGSTDGSSRRHSSAGQPLSASSGPALAGAARS